MSTLHVETSLSLGDFALEINHHFPLAGITALFGPSGSGKSTLLRIIAGLEYRSRGVVRFRNEVWQGTDPNAFVPPHRRGIGYVFQDARLFPHLTVRGNLAYAEKRSRTGSSAIAFDDVVRVLDLEPLLSRRATSLSGGEIQRVAIGRSLLARPRLLLMDEPLAALDLKRKGEILPYIDRLPEIFDLPVIYVTHAIEEVAHLATTMVILGSGRTVAHGRVADVLERLDLPDAMGHFEAGVVLSARVVGHDEQFQLTTLDHGGQSIVMPMAEVEPGTELRLRVRARDVSLATQRPNGISVRNILTGVVSDVAEEPDTAFAEVLVDIGGARLRSRITRHALVDLSLRPGTPVFALVKSIAFDRRALSPNAGGPGASPPAACETE